MQTFDEALAEFIERSRQLLHKESPEDRPPPHPAPPLDPNVIPVPSALILTEDLIRRYAYAIGEDNPLYTDPAYGERSWLGSQVAPPTILIHVRFPADHGVQRPQGYPVANFLSGVAWEFYDVLRPGMRFTSSKIPRELVVTRGRQGKVIFHHSENFYWTNCGALKAKAYGRLIHLPVEQMGGTRVMPVERLGERMLYNREPHHYSSAEIEKLSEALEKEQRRGARVLSWEEVDEGDELPNIVQPPYSIRDALTYQSLDHGLLAALDGTRLVRAFRPAYRRSRQNPAFARTHPVTGWPYTPYDEHEDRHLAPYRCQPLPFDFGIQRAQAPIRLLTNWAGDNAFVHRMYTTMRRPIFYGDAAIYKGKVIRKYVAEKTDTAGRTVSYAAVAIEIVGLNQRDEVHCLGYATVFLPSAAMGQPVLPVPHADRPEYVPFDVHRRAGWF
ncbi:MaoC family dehydratase N-terminal domain-containing protein [Microtetraspora sp. NBRC 16547]|uniref:FAS1-like dehydratase domain-containing protein n=1 Tax=Microtetraspora sp. NBRC 16547 TaxID=3030993 RepID=UPI0024A4B006|nr:MaoC family dehydratase N-terminal domain-containing protein [Microtetraspora sp. NBRC 16547]GLW96479.1 acyl dehydratase [Microtetraspora sp. NBRC 16547]